MDDKLPSISEDDTGMACALYLVTSHRLACPDSINSCCQSGTEKNNDAPGPHRGVVGVPESVMLSSVVL